MQIINNFRLFRHIRFLLLFFLILIQSSCEIKQDQVSALAKAKEAKIELLKDKYNSLLVRIENLEDKIKEKKELLEEMQEWPDRNEEQEEIIEGLIEELEEELEELKKEGEAIGAEAKVVKGNDKKAALELIDKNFREEIRRLKAIRDRLIKKNGPGDIILAEQMDKNIRQLEDLFRKANEEVNSEEETM